MVKDFAYVVKGFDNREPGLDCLWKVGCSEIVLRGFHRVGNVVVAIWLIKYLKMG